MKAGLFLTGECNLACDYCYAVNCPPRAMTSEVLAQSLAFLHAQAGGELGLTLIGGEPLLCPEAVREVIREVSTWEDTRLGLALATNGTLLDAAMLELCREHAIQIYLSLDGTREAHDRHRRSAAGRQPVRKPEPAPAPPKAGDAGTGNAKP